MSLFKRKNLKKALIVMVNLASLTVFVWEMLNPALANAADSQKWSIFSQKTVKKEYFLGKTVEERMLPSATANAAGTPDRKVMAVLTAYSSTVDQCDSDPFIAASGKRVYDGMVAANWLPFGTKIKIPALYGDKVFTVDDRMNARYGFGRMDVWLDAPRQEVNAFGVKRLEIEIYYPTQNLAMK